MSPEERDAALNAALVRAQMAARAVGKGARNEHHRYRYASAESIIDEARGALASCGLAMHQSHVVLVPGEVSSSSEDAPMPPLAQVTYVLAHEAGGSRTWHRQWPVIEGKGRPLDKAHGGALTTALAYALRDLLMLPRDDDAAAMDRRDDTAHEPGRVAEDRPRQTPRGDLPPELADEPYAEDRSKATGLALYYEMLEDATTTGGVEVVAADAKKGLDESEYREFRARAAAKFERLAQAEDQGRAA